MEVTYEDWLFTRVPLRDTLDLDVIKKLYEIKIKNKIFRRIDATTRIVAMSLRDDFIFGMNRPNPENRYDGKISVLELIFALVYPYEFNKIEGVTANHTKDKFGNVEPDEETRKTKRIKILYPLLDEFRGKFDKPLVFVTMAEELYSGKFRPFLANRIPKIDRMPIRDQLAIYLNKKKVIKLEKKALSGMIKDAKERFSDDDLLFNLVDSVD